MDVKAAVKGRKSIRAFRNQSVEPEKIERILEHARYAPSGANTQPWHVAVISGETKLRLQEAFEKAFIEGKHGKMDYHYYPQVWPEKYKNRRKETGLILYKTLGIKKEDKAGQAKQWRANYRAFDAPVMLLFLIDRELEKGSYMDYGMFLQSIMLMALDEGLATCPQAALAEYPDIVREVLKLPDDKMVLVGMALGYENQEAKVNSYRTSRESVESFVSYYS